MTDPTALREAVRARYAAAARHAAAGDPDRAREVEAGGCGGGPAATTAAAAGAAFGGELYDSTASDGAVGSAVAASLGCGVPTAVADLHPGEVVLDLGSGAGADVLISARRVGPTGHVIGVDMTPEMLDLARAHAAQAQVSNVEFLQGYLEELPLPDASVDVVLSNCVINLAADKHLVLAEAARVLRPGGRFAVSDVLADHDMGDAVRADLAQWTGCIAGALTREQLARALTDAGLVDVEIRETHRVHDHAFAAIIRARKPPHAS
ncbi:MAG: arsenite methyltransferase [Mycobacteriales bacterium]